MENYSKGKNVEEELVKEKIGISNLPEDIFWMKVKGGSKMRNLLEVALNEYKDGKDVLWSGSGPALGKTISCAEVMKKKFSTMHQFNKICYRRSEEYWDPKIDGLDQLVVNRDVPMIHILLSHDPINKDEPGYQMVGTIEPQSQNRHRKFQGPKKFTQNSFQKRSSNQDNSQMESYGLRFNRKKNTRKQNKDRQNNKDSE